MKPAGQQITIDDFVMFCERTIGFFETAVGHLDDTQVNQIPALPGANSPFQLMTHALAVSEWWTAHMVCGHDSDRDRNTEFEAAGSVTDLLAAAATTRSRLRELAPELRAATELQHRPVTQQPLDGEWTVGAALLHAYEELAQHLGQLQITLDLIRNPRR